MWDARRGGARGGARTRTTSRIERRAQRGGVLRTEDRHRRHRRARPQVAVRDHPARLQRARALRPHLHRRGQRDATGRWSSIAPSTAASSASSPCSSSTTPARSRCGWRRCRRAAWSSRRSRKSSRAQVAKSLQGARNPRRPGPVERQAGRQDSSRAAGEDSVHAGDRRQGSRGRHRRGAARDGTAAADPMTVDAFADRLSRSEAAEACRYSSAARTVIRGEDHLASHSTVRPVQQDQLPRQPPHPRARGARHRRRRRRSSACCDRRGAAHRRGGRPRSRRGFAQGDAARLQDHGLRQVQVRGVQEAQRRASKHQSTVTYKEIKFRPKTDDHDLRLQGEAHPPLPAGGQQGASWSSSSAAARSSTRRRGRTMLKRSSRLTQRHRAGRAAADDGRASHADDHRAARRASSKPRRHRRGSAATGVPHRRLAARPPRRCGAPRRGSRAGRRAATGRTATGHCAATGHAPRPATPQTAKPAQPTVSVKPPAK